MLPFRTHIFAIAVEEYSDPAIPPVAYAKNDAEAFVAAWQILGVDTGNIVTLLDDKATLTSITSRLRKWVCNIGPEDRVIVFYAGHGATFGTQSHLTTHDTQPDDVENTSLALADLLATINKAKPAQSILFLDTAHGAASATAGFKETLPPHCLVFTSCGQNEISHSSKLLKHGLWTYSILQALKEGNAALTAKDLQDYLLKEVPRQLRKAITGAATQTPVFFGKNPKDVIVADLSTLKKASLGNAKESSAGAFDAALAGETHGRVKELSGYHKPMHPLKNNSPWEQNFVKNAGANEVASQADIIHQKIRDSFRYKRKDIDVAKDGSTASIKTPDFDVNVTLAQDPADTDRYILRTQVTSFRAPQVVDDPVFIMLFSQYCDRVVIEPDATLNIEAKIDEIEEIDAFTDHLTYDANCTHFTLLLPDLKIILHATASQMTFSLEGANDLKLLIANTQKAVRKLAGTSVALGLL